MPTWMTWDGIAMIRSIEARRSIYVSASATIGTTEKIDPRQAMPIISLHKEDWPKSVPRVAERFSSPEQFKQVRTHQIRLSG